MDTRRDRILKFMKEKAYKPLLFKELATVLDVPKEDREEFATILQDLELDGKIIKTSKDRYGVPERMNLIVGRLQGNERGYGFVIPDEENIGDIFIPADSLNGAMNSDKVVARVSKKMTTERRAEGEIVKIIKRGSQTFVGTYESSKYFGFVIPDDKRMSSDIFIPKDEANGAKTGQKVVAEITKWPEKRRNAEGRIIEIIGNMGEPGTDILSIIKAYGLEEDFPEEVLLQVSQIEDKISKDDLKGRRDLRDLRMITIDGEDAKDLDDAVSIERLDNGVYRLGVHIADVSHYVKENSPLDVEAFKRGTSVYLVDRVIPMLPRKLSNGICSLNPNVDRLAFSVMMDIDSTGKVIAHDIFESVINTNERMTYTDVYKILEENNEELIKKYDYLVDDFKDMKELSITLRKKRMDRGAIDFDFEESKIILDEKGVPVEVKKYEITIANKIIEEFMLVCNETVSEHFYWFNAPFVYRIHENPDPERIEIFAEFVHNFGYVLKGINKIHPKALQQLLEQVKGTKEERIISTIMLRSLKKARYTNVNDIHFGLAAKFYSHFTSPIRRYPDLIIHRIMKEALKTGISSQREEYLNSELPEITKNCSERERAAEEAERETKDLKKVEYMKKYEGEVFEGIISGVTSFGMFVELENTIEGMVRLSDLDDDYYIYNEKQYSLIGERTRKIYKIGDEVKVKLAKADLAAKKIDFLLVKSETGEEEKEMDLQKKVKVKKTKGKNSSD